MELADILSDGRGVVRERPSAIIVGVLVAVVALDLLAKVVGFRLLLGGTHVFGGNVPIARLITLLWDGIVVGLAIGLAGIGLSMTYSILGFANFSHGDYVTAGAFSGWSIAYVIAGFGAADVGYLLLVGHGSGPTPGQLGISVLSTPIAIFVGLVLSALATVALALAMDRVVYRPMRDQGAISLLIASIGVALALRYLIVFLFGGQTRGLTAGTQKLILAGVDGRLAFATNSATIQAAIRGQVPANQFYVEIPLLDIGTYSSEILNVTSQEITLVVASLALMGALHLMLQGTRLGKAMRAMADNKDLARVTGIPSERVIRATWIIGGGLAGASGYLIALERGTLSFDLGWVLLLLIFAAVILGGIGSIYGAMAGGVIIGLTSSLSLLWIPSSFATASAFAIMILMLLFKPDGLFGGVTTA